MGAQRVLRLHFPDGRTVSEPIEKTARENRTNVAGARELIASWIAAGDLVERPDGGYDVIRHRNRQRPTASNEAGESCQNI